MQLLNYTVPVLKTNTSYGEFIEFQVFNSDKQKFDRHRIRLQKIRQLYTNKRQYVNIVNTMMMQLNLKLANGWNPGHDNLEDRLFTPICTALDRYTEDRAKELRPMTMVSYTSLKGILLGWLQEHDLEQTETRLFNQNMAIQFMESLLTHDKFNNNTYNTYLKKYLTCFNWLLAHGYCKENPFEKIPIRSRQTKIRCLIPADVRARILKYVRTSANPNFEIVMHLVFSSFIRPTEITRIQIKDIDLFNGCICINEDKAKTHRVRYAPLSNDSIMLLAKLLAPGYPNDWYLLGKDLVPSKEQTWNARYKKEWMKIRKACNLPAEMQLYSLKDSGITELVEAGVDLNTIKIVVGHSDISTTNKYLGHFDKDIIQKVRSSPVRLEYATNKATH